MAIGFVFEAKGVTQAQYDQVRKETAPDNTLPKGMLYHAGGPTDGGWCVIEVWESEDAATRHMNNVLKASLARAKIDVKPRMFEVHNIMKRGDQQRDTASRPQPHG